MATLLEHISNIEKVYQVIDGAHLKMQTLMVEAAADGFDPEALRTAVQFKRTFQQAKPGSKALLDLYLAELAKS